VVGFSPGTSRSLRISMARRKTTLAAALMLAALASSCGGGGDSGIIIDPPVPIYTHDDVLPDVPAGLLLGAPLDGLFEITGVTIRPEPQNTTADPAELWLQLGTRLRFDQGALIEVDGGDTFVFRPHPSAPVAPGQLIYRVNDAIFGQSAVCQGVWFVDGATGIRYESHFGLSGGADSATTGILHAKELNVLTDTVEPPNSGLLFASYRLDLTLVAGE
jgi:hypothetical protein